MKLSLLLPTTISLAGLVAQAAVAPAVTPKALLSEEKRTVIPIVCIPIPFLVTCDADTAASTSVRSVSSVSVQSAASIASVSQASRSAISAASVIATAVPVIPVLGLQTFYGALGGIFATPVVAVGSTYVVGVDVFSSTQLTAALTKSCDNQNTLCAASSTLSFQLVWTVAQCTAQNAQCKAKIGSASLASVSSVSATSVAAQASISLTSVGAQATLSAASVSRASVSSVSATSVAGQASNSLASVSRSSVASLAASTAAQASISRASIISVSSVSAAAASASAIANSPPVLATGWSLATSSLVAEGSGGRALISDSFTDSNMTPLLCSTYCSAHGYPLAGTEWYTECYCGSVLSNGASLGKLSTTSPTPCGGGGGNCGGDSALSLYYDTTKLSASLAPLTTTPTTTLPSGYKVASPSLIAEGSSGRALVGASTDSSTNTPATCAAYCTAAGFAISATEYYSQCFCGNALSNGASLSITSNSSPTACSGDSTQTCGGSNALSVVYNTALITLNNGVFTLVNGGSAAVILPSGYKVASTSLVAEGSSGRALIGASTESSAMTPSTCATFCTAAGFAISATEYYTQCFCGNALSNGASLSITSTSAPTACSGDSTQTCGGSNALSVVYNTALAALSNGVITLINTAPAGVILPDGYKVASTSLIAEGTSGRALIGTSTDSSTTTPSTCAAFCTAAGFAISATEYYTQCFCGNALSNGASLSIVSHSSPTACTGDSSQTCGGSNALSVVYNTALVTLSNGVFTLVNAAPAGARLPDGYKVVSTSLIAEGTSGRALTGATTSSSSMTPTVCAQYCTAAGFALSGTEYSSQCFCGNSLWNGASLSLLSTSSPYPCSGDASQTCGGYSALSIVYNTGLATLNNGVITIINQSTLPTGWTLVSLCVAEPSSGRLLAGDSLFDNAMTVEMCTSYCGGKGFNQAGLEFSTQCFCGASVDFTKASISNNCNMAAGGNSNQNGGGINALSIWILPAKSRRSLPPQARRGF